MLDRIARIIVGLAGRARLDIISSALSAGLKRRQSWPACLQRSTSGKRAMSGA
jgi:hypothetical protein